MGADILNVATMGIYGSVINPPDDPKSEEELSKEASKKAEFKRLSMERQKSNKGKTMFSQPVGAGGGAPLKQALGE